MEHLHDGVIRQVGDGDFFWEANGRAQFPKMAEDVDVQLNKYKAAVEELNRKTGANVDADMDPNELMQVRRVRPVLVWHQTSRFGLRPGSGSGSGISHLPHVEALVLTTSSVRRSTHLWHWQSSCRSCLATAACARHHASSTTSVLTMPAPTVAGAPECSCPPTQQNTRGLMAAVSSLPELTERKRTIDKHTNLATALLGAIQARLY